eukprot:ctg_652.g422
MRVRDGGGVGDGAPALGRVPRCLSTGRRDVWRARMAHAAAGVPGSACGCRRLDGGGAGDAADGVGGGGHRGPVAAGDGCGRAALAAGGRDGADGDRRSCGHCAPDRPGEWPVGGRGGGRRGRGGDGGRGAAPAAAIGVAAGGEPLAAAAVGRGSGGDRRRHQRRARAQSGRRRVRYGHLRYRGGQGGQRYHHPRRSVELDGGGGAVGPQRVRQRAQVPPIPTEAAVGSAAALGEHDYGLAGGAGAGHRTAAARADASAAVRTRAGAATQRHHLQRVRVHAVVCRGEQPARGGARCVLAAAPLADIRGGVGVHRRHAGGAGGGCRAHRRWPIHRHCAFELGAVAGERGAGRVGVAGGMGGALVAPALDAGPQRLPGEHRGAPAERWTHSAAATAAVRGVCGVVVALGAAVAPAAGICARHRRAAAYAARQPRAFGEVAPAGESGSSAVSGAAPDAQPPLGVDRRVASGAQRVLSGGNRHRRGGGDRRAAQRLARQARLSDLPNPSPLPRASRCVPRCALLQRLVVNFLVERLHAGVNALLGVLLGEEVILVEVVDDEPLLALDPQQVLPHRHVALHQQAARRVDHAQCRDAQRGGAAQTQKGVKRRVTRTPTISSRRRASCREAGVPGAVRQCPSALVLPATWFPSCPPCASSWEMR